MKKNIIIAAAAILALGLTACEPEIINPSESPISQTNTPKVQTTSDLDNTDWSYTVTYSEFLYNLLGADLSCVPDFQDDTMVFGLNFDGTYAHFSFPENVMAFGGDEGELQQIYGVSYEYSYDGTTHTGYLDGVADADDSTVAAHLQFTYDDNTDEITFVLPMVYAEDNTPVNLTLVFVRNEE